MKSKPSHIKQEDWDAVDSPAISEKILARMQPVSDAHPDVPSRVSAPSKPLKVTISIKLSPEVVEYFRSQGKEWQTKIDKVLIEYVKIHQTV